MFKSKFAVGLLAGLAWASSVQASSVSYYLDQSNALADGTNYLKVTIDDEGAPDAINFTVEILQPLLGIAGNNFGIQKFAFNVVGGTGASAKKLSDLPDNWKARNGGRMSGFGLFDITVQGRGNNRQDPLTFSITGVKLDTIQSYIDLSTGSSPQGFSLFSAHVAGFNFGECGDTKSFKGSVARGNSSGKNGSSGQNGSSGKGGSSGSNGSSGDSGGKCVTSGFFGGNTNAVPAPPAIWLLGTAVAGLVVRRVRGSAKAPAVA